MKQKLISILLLILLLPVNNSHAVSSVEQNGDILQIVVPLAGLGTTLAYEKDNSGSKQFFKAFATSQLITYSLKALTQKTRPNGSCCASFPSGHTSAAFMGASFIQHRYGWKYAVPAYIAASYVGYSRVYAQQHYVEDVLAGAMIGVLSSHYLVSPYKNIQILPVVEQNRLSLLLHWQW